MNKKKFPVYKEENGVLTEFEDQSKTQLYVMKEYSRINPYLGFPIPENGMNIYHCVTGINSWTHKIVLSEKTENFLFPIVYPSTENLLFPRIEKLVPVSELSVKLLGRTFTVMDENTFLSEGYYNTDDDNQNEIELRVWDKPTIKINGTPIKLKISKKSIYSGGMCFNILNVGGIGLGLAYTNTSMPTRFYVQPVRSHKKVNLSIFKRVRTITETKSGNTETVHYEFQ